MDKLERYLDQVCRGIGGPRELRQHVRQELREHLLDAMAGHKAAGLAEDAALDRALADFGGPDEVRSELEALHGHRLLGVAIDKALDWKEKTMKAKWLWASWANLAVATVVALELAWLVFAGTMLVPRFQWWQDRWLDPGVLSDLQVRLGCQGFWRGWRPAANTRHGCSWPWAWRGGCSSGACAVTTNR